MTLPDVLAAGLLAALAITNSFTLIAYGKAKRAKRDSDDQSRRLRDIVEYEKNLAQGLFRSLTESAVDAIIVADPAGKIIFTNDRARECFGYSGPQIMSRRLCDLFPELPLSTFRGDLGGSAFASGGRAVAMTGVRSDNGKFPAELSLSCFEFQEKFHFTAIVRDVSRRLELESRVILAEKMESLGTMAAGLAHDFKSVLGIIIGRASIMESMLERNRLDGPALAGHLAAITRGSELGMSLVRQIVEFARHAELKRAPVQINELIKEVLNVIDGDGGATKPVVRLELDPDLQPVFCDDLRIRQVVFNLVLNARQATAGEGFITVSSSLSRGAELRARWLEAGEGDYARIRVSDTGQGIDKEKLAKVFEPFSSTKISGSGLGLAVVYGIVKQHFGFIDVSSEVGVGTSFEFYLPVSPSAAMQVKPSGTSHDQRSVESDHA